MNNFKAIITFYILIVKAYATYIYITFLFSSILLSCVKDEATKTDGRLTTNTYCNNPEAINYNWDFPGTPDNTKCYFPTQVFKGTYFFRDSILDSDLKLKSRDSFNIILTAISNTKMTLKGFCQGTGEISMTADRYYKSFVDSLRIDYNNVTTTLVGQYLCSQKDTVSGYLIKSPKDSSISVFFTVASDSGYIYHKGIATKQ